MINQELLSEISKIKDPRNSNINISPQKCLELAIAVKRGEYKYQVETTFIGGQCQCIARLQILSGMDDSEFVSKLMAQMQSKQIESYTRHGCNIKPCLGKKLMLIEYYQDVTNHEFLGAYKNGGLYEKLDEAKAIAKQYPGYEMKLGIPDLVFLCQDTEVDSTPP